MEVGLVSCVKSKRDDPALPQELYTSDYFTKMRIYAEGHHDTWYILSARHGLLIPDAEPIEPYNETLRDATKAEKRTWAQRVVEQMKDEHLLEQGNVLVVHAGKDYHEELIPLLKDTNVTVEIPTEGLRIGEKKAWYNKHT
jgi:hypothetical protein